MKALVDFHLKKKLKFETKYFYYACYYYHLVLQLSLYVYILLNLISSKMKRNIRNSIFSHTKYSCDKDKVQLKVQ